MSMRVRLTVAAIAMTVPASLMAPAAAQAGGAIPATSPVASQKKVSPTSVSPTSKRIRFSEYPTADWRTRSSAWTGFRLRHPRGGRLSPMVTRWANLVLAVMGEHRIPARHLSGILAQIQQESSGNPYAVNNWDSNASRGTPSKGLLQVILPTYRAYAKPGYRARRYQTVPYTNIWAALNYVMDRYGRSKFKSWGKGRNQGY